MLKPSPFVALLAVAAVVPLAACGSDKKTASKVPAKLAITATESGKTTTLDVTGDKTPGTTEMTFTNNGKQPHSAQLVAVNGEHSKAEVEKAYNGVSNGKAAPSWFFAAGGAGNVNPGQTVPVGVKLLPATFWAIDDAGDKPSGFTKFVVKGDTNAAALPTGPTVTASEYKFQTPPGGLKAGDNTIVLQNAGKQWHHMQAFPLNKGATLAQAAKFLKSQGKSGGPPPIDFQKGTGTAVIEGGGTLTTTLNLKPGKYALVCFVSDRQGGPPHVAKGMVAETDVK
jgi:hypothetical protein